LVVDGCGLEKGECDQALRGGTRENAASRVLDISAAPTLEILKPITDFVLNWKV